jgi:hypothetical protein
VLSDGACGAKISCETHSGSASTEQEREALNEPSKLPVQVRLTGADDPDEFRDPVKHQPTGSTVQDGKWVPKHAKPSRWIEVLKLLRSGARHGMVGR